MKEWSVVPVRYVPDPVRGGVGRVRWEGPSRHHPPDAYRVYCREWRDGALWQVYNEMTWHLVQDAVALETALSLVAARMTAQMDEI